MPFEPGKPKTGGRQKGTGNRKPPMKSLRHSLAELGFDLGKELNAFLLRADVDASARLKALELIARYTQVVPTKEETPIDPDDEIVLPPADLVKAIDEINATN